jgi:GT2 family glycosyltransferase
MIDLSIIIVNYNVKEFLQNLIHSIEKASNNLSTEIIVVDNASTDGSVELIKSKFPSIILIENKSNLGFGKANNQGLKISNGNFILLLNPDTIVSEETFLKMIEFFKNNPEAGLATPKILNPDGSLQLGCRRSFPGPWTSFCKVTGLSNLLPNSRIFARYNLTYLPENQTNEVDAISGSFMMMKREVYEKVGGFDEQFFMYGEDLDLCYRIQKAGFKVFYVHSTQIIHYKGESTKRSDIDELRVFYEAMRVFVKKHLATSFVVSLILRSAINLREILAYIWKRKLIIHSILFDVLFFNFSLFISEKFYMNSVDWNGFEPQHLVVVYTIPVFLHFLVASFSGVYDRNRLSLLRNFAATILSFVILSSTTFFFKQYAYSRAVVIFTYITFILLSTFWRLIVKVFFKIGIQNIGALNKRVIIVGTQDNAIQLAKKLRNYQRDVHSFIGLVAKSHSEVGKNFEGFDVVGTLQNFRKVLKEKNVSEVIFAGEELTYSEMIELVSSCQKDNIEFRISGVDRDFIVGKTSVSMLDDIPLIEVNYNISNTLQKTIKNIFDYSIAILTLLFIYPFVYLWSKISRSESYFKKFVFGVPSILTGKSSFVGPENESDNNRTYLGKKGLTGLWFIEDNKLVQKDRLDFYYARNQNIWLDLEILAKSLSKMFNNKR